MIKTPSALIDYRPLPDGSVKIESGKLVHDPTGGGGSTSGGDGSGDPLGANLTKFGVVLGLGNPGSFDEQIVESLIVIRDPRSGRYVGTYVGYDATTRARAGYAYSDDLVTWTKAGVLLPHSGTPGAPDENGVTGPVLLWDTAGDRYVLYYIGLTATGYEGGTKTVCYATADSLAGPWTRHGAVITPDAGSSWRAQAVWHVSIVERAGTWYCFFNATSADGKERIGYATAPTITGPWSVDDANSPVIDVVAGSWESQNVGDPSVRRIGDVWVMDYYGFNGTSASDGIAVTSDGDFPLGWTRHPGNPILSPSETYDAQFAHKPCTFVDGGRVFHYYTAVAADNTRQVALATSGVTSSVPDLSTAPVVTGETTDELLNSLLDSLQTLGLQVNITSPPLVSDDFNRADGALNGTQTSDGNATWVAGASFAVLSNAAKFTGTSDQTAVVDAGVSDNFAVEFKAAAISGRYPLGLALRVAGGTYVKFFRDQTSNVWGFQAPAGTPVATAAYATDLAAGDVVRVEVVGNTYTLKVNGVTIPATSGSFVSSVNNTATSHGILGAGNIPLTVDDFKIEAL